MQIHFDASRGNREAVTRELKRGVAIDAERSIDGWTPLMAAAASHRAGPGMLRFLIGRGADVNRVSSGSIQETALLLAARLGSPEKVAVLLERGANAGFRNEHGSTPLTNPPCCRDAERTAQVVRLLLAAGVDPDAKSIHGESALRGASRDGQFDLVRILLEAGADSSRLEWTPLMQAVALGTLEGVREELRRRSDLAARDRWDRTPFLVSAAGGAPEKAELLLQAGSGLDERGHCGATALMLAVRSDHAGMVAWLLRAGADVDARNEFGDTALLKASAFGATRSVRLLLDAGADPRAEDRHNSQPISSATNPEIVRMLMAAGADLNFRDGQGYTALTRAAEEGDEEMVAALLAMGAPPDYQSVCEQALHRAAKTDSAEVVKVLLQAGADPNLPDVDDWTPLMWRQTPGVARRLLAGGADLTPDAERSWREMGKQELLEVLVPKVRRFDFRIGIIPRTSKRHDDER